MTERERWIIYPLLFFLFLMVTRDRLVSPIQAEFETVICKRLVVESTDGRKVVEAASLMDSGVLIVYGTMNDDAANTPIRGNLPPTSPVLQFGGESAGGYLTLYGPESAPTLKLGHHHALSLSGLLAVEPLGDPLPPSTANDGRYWGLNVPWSPPEADEAASPDDSADDSDDSGGVGDLDKGDDAN